MSALGDRLAQRTADASYIQVGQASQALALPTTYYNGATLHAAGTTTQSTSNKLASIGARRAANQATVSSTIAQRQQAKSVQDALAAAQKREAAADAAAKAAQDSYNIATPTKPNIPVQLIQQVDKTKPPKTKTGYADDRRSGNLYGSGSSTSFKTTGNKANTSGAAGALGGVRGSGTYQYVNNSTLGSGRNKVLALATSYLGTTYVLGGTGHTGIDCSGLVQTVYRQLGFKVPTHSAADQGQTGGRNNGNGIPGTRTSIRNLQPGDLVAWKDGSHIAIYAGNGKIIEATRTASVNRGTVYRTLWAPESAVIGIHVQLPGDMTRSQAQSKSVAKKAATYR